MFGGGVRGDLPGSEVLRQDPSLRSPTKVFLHMLATQAGAGSGRALGGRGVQSRLPLPGGGVGGPSGCSPSDRILPPQRPGLPCG